ncbi:cold shock domain-containing protein [Streptomyces sp. c-19]|uniref:cold shock domain-containing protein n=1 Tax=Streptomyces sp. c-19 TaxID=2789275 RepID=UPI0039810ADF
MWLPPITLRQDKGFGFIAQDGDPDVFAHYSNTSGTCYRELVESEDQCLGARRGRRNRKALPTDFPVTSLIRQVGLSHE